MKRQFVTLGEGKFLGKYPGNCGKAEKKLRIGKKKYLFHQPIRRQHSDIRCNYVSNLSMVYYYWLFSVYPVTST